MLENQSNSPLGGSSFLSFLRLGFFSVFGVSSGIGSVSSAQSFLVSPTLSLTRQDSRSPSGYGRRRSKGRCFWQLALAQFGGLMWPTPWNVEV